MSSFAPKKPDIHKMHSLLVENISPDVTEQDIREKFEQYGEVGDVFEPFDKITGKRKSFLFVRYLNEKNMYQAMHSLNDFVFKNE